MQYVGKVGGYVYNQWNSLNPATLSGAIDIIVVEQPDGSLHCSPWHVRFGKFQIIKPSQKKIDLYVNDKKTNLPMKLGDGGEAFFVFEADNHNDLLSQSVLTSPVISPTSSAGSSPGTSPQVSVYDLAKSEPDLLDLNVSRSDDLEKKVELLNTLPERLAPGASPPSFPLQIAFEKARKITQKLNIPSKIDVNGDMVLDMDGYKPNAQKNIDNSDEMFKEIFLKELKELTNNNNNNNNNNSNSDGDGDMENEFHLWDQIISKDKDGNIRILSLNNNEVYGTDDDISNTSMSLLNSEFSDNEDQVSQTLKNTNEKKYFKTLRLTSEQLQKMDLQYGENSLKFKLSEGNSQVSSNLYLWKSSTPLVISDIDGTITKSDALGHVLNLIGRDWTHPGVAKLFDEIHLNGYNIMYLTARSVGQADSTRQYLRGVSQEGIALPRGPVILSPDRTIAALRREVILKKPEVFKMSCLNDIKSLYNDGNEIDQSDDRTPFYAGFGNRITDAISYRSVNIPSHRIFTINPNGEVNMELLQLAGYKSSYLRIGELVDQFFPPIKEVSTLNSYWNNNQFDEYINNSKEYSSPSPGSPRSFKNENPMMDVKTDEKFNDVNYWREPINISDLSDIEDEEEIPPEPKSPRLMSLRSFGSTELHSSSNKPRSTSVSDKPASLTFASPLKQFMTFGGNSDSISSNPDDSLQSVDTSFTDDYEDENDDFYDYDEDEDEDEDYEEDTQEEDSEDDYEDEDDLEDDEEDEEVDDEDLDYEGPINDVDVNLKLNSAKPGLSSNENDQGFIKASEFSKLSI